MRIRYSIRAILIAVALAAPACIYIADYLKKRPDYILPTPAEYSSTVKSQQDRMANAGIALVKMHAIEHAQALAARSPPRGLNYWESRAKKVLPGMHQLALTRQLPNATIGTSFLVPGKNTQVLVYAVDSELAAICEVTSDATTVGPKSAGPNSLERVVRFHGFTEHGLAFDEWGSLDAETLDFDDHGRAVVRFGTDGK